MDGEPGGEEVNRLFTLAAWSSSPLHLTRPPPAEYFSADPERHRSLEAIASVLHSPAVHFAGDRLSQQHPSAPAAHRSLTPADSPCQGGPARLLPHHQELPRTPPPTPALLTPALFPSCPTASASSSISGSMDDALGTKIASSAVPGVGFTRGGCCTACRCCGRRPHFAVTAPHSSAGMSRVCDQTTVGAAHHKPCTPAAAGADRGAMAACILCCQFNSHQPSTLVRPSGQVASTTSPSPSPPPPLPAPLNLACSAQQQRHRRAPQRQRPGRCCWRRRPRGHVGRDGAAGPAQGAERVLQGAAASPAWGPWIAASNLRQRCVHCCQRHAGCCFLYNPAS